MLDAFGGVDIEVSVANEDWEWDEGASDFEQWLKKQSAYPDDNELEKTLPPEYVHPTPHTPHFFFAAVFVISKHK